MAEVALPGPVPRYELPEWRTRYGVVAGITGRGTDPEPFDLGLAGFDAPVGAVIPRWHQLLRSVPGMRGVLVSKQVHGADILWHDDARGLVLFEGSDGHATSSAGLLLAVTAADCIPVYLLDPVRRAIALVHAGWRGTAARIVERAIGMLVERGSRVDNLLVHCGVGICGRCYEVGSEVFTGCGVPVPAAGKGLLDLRGVLTGQAKAASVETVSTSHFCSAHDAGHFFSHRASAGADGRMVAYLGLLPETV